MTGSVDTRWVDACACMLWFIGLCWRLCFCSPERRMIRKVFCHVPTQAAGATARALPGVLELEYSAVYR